MAETSPLLDVEENAPGTQCGGQSCGITESPIAFGRKGRNAEQSAALQLTFHYCQLRAADERLSLE
ncbi:hypothetical protein ACFQ7M_18730 [Streptomyces massasporeus]